MVAELAEEAETRLGELGHPLAHGHAHVAEPRRVLAQLVAAELRQRPALRVQVRAERVQLLVAARHDVLQHQRAAVVDLGVDLAELAGGADLEHVPAEPGLERQRLDRLEDAREADLLHAALEVGRGVDEHRLGRVHAGAPGRLHLGALVVQPLHGLPARERDEVVRVEAVGVPGDRPDVLVVRREEDALAREAPAEVFEERDEGLLVLRRVRADHAGGKPGAQPDGARVRVQREQRHAFGREVAQDVEAVRPGDLEDERRMALFGELENRVEAHVRPFRVRRRAPGRRPRA